MADAPTASQVVVDPSSRKVIVVCHSPSTSDRLRETQTQTVKGGNAQLWRAIDNTKAAMELSYDVMVEDGKAFVVFTEPNTGLRARARLVWTETGNYKGWDFPNTPRIEVEQGGSDATGRKSIENASARVLTEIATAVRMASSNDMASSSSTSGVLKDESDTQKASGYAAKASSRALLDDAAVRQGSRS